MNSLVSSIYRLAPNTPPQDAWATQKRLQAAIARLVKQFGGKEVRRRIREAPGPEDVKARLVLLAFSDDLLE